MSVREKLAALDARHYTPGYRAGTWTAFACSVLATVGFVAFRSLP